MSVESAPTEYFDNIYYNPSFYQQSNGISLAYGTANYVSRVGTATSVATSTKFSGSVLCNTISDTTSGAGTLTINPNTTNIDGDVNFSDNSTASSVNIGNTNGLKVNTIAPNTGSTISVSADTANIIGVTAITIETIGSSGSCNLINSSNQITGSNTGFGTPANYILASTNGSYNQMTAGYSTYMGYNQIDSQNVTGTYANLIIARNGDNKIVSNTGANNIIGVKNSISANITTPLVPADGYAFLQALTGISNYIGTIAKLTQTAILTTIANTTIALSGTTNTMTAINSNVISTTGTSSGSSNQMLANGSTTFPNAFNLIQAAGYAGYNTISALNQAGLGYNIIEAWNLNQMTTASSTGTNELLSSGLNGSNYIHTSNTNGSNMILSSGTNGINTISAPQNTITSSTNNNIVNTGTGTNTITSLVSNTLTAPTIALTGAVNITGLATSTAGFNATTASFYQVSSKPLATHWASSYLGGTPYTTSPYSWDTSTAFPQYIFPTLVTPVSIIVLFTNTGAITGTGNLKITIVNATTTTIVYATYNLVLNATTGSISIASTSVAGVQIPLNAPVSCYAVLTATPTTNTKLLSVRWGFQQN
jgi:hypothetical protein